MIEDDLQELQQRVDSLQQDFDSLVGQILLLEILSNPCLSELEWVCWEESVCANTSLTAEQEQALVQIFDFIKPVISQVYKQVCVCIKEFRFFGLQGDETIC